VSLKDARLARDAARLRVKGDRRTPGVDIAQEKRAARQEAKATELKLDLPTFEECAEIYIRERWLTWSKKHRDQWRSSLKWYACATRRLRIGSEDDGDGNRRRCFCRLCFWRLA
jgi:hypothetical protein